MTWNVQKMKKRGDLWSLTYMRMEKRLRCIFMVLYGFVWFGMVWYGLVWYGLAGKF